MIVFHIDRRNEFPSDPALQYTKFTKDYANLKNPDETNRIIETIYNGEISLHGLRYLTPIHINTSDLEQTQKSLFNMRLHIVEYIFEVVRHFEFPHRPSRFLSLFACQSKKDLYEWYSKQTLKLLNEQQNAVVKVIEVCDNFFIGDAYWRDIDSNNGGSAVFSPQFLHRFAQQYWSGNFAKKEQDRRLEVLCVPPVKVLDTIQIVDFFNI